MTTRPSLSILQRGTRRGATGASTAARGALFTLTLLVATATSAGQAPTPTPPTRLTAAPTTARLTQEQLQANRRVAAQLELERNQPVVTISSGQAARIRQSVRLPALQAGDLVVQRSGSTAKTSQVEGKTAFVLPYSIKQITQTADGTKETIDLEAQVLIERNLRAGDNPDVFVGQISLGLRGRGGGSEALPRDQHMSFHVNSPGLHSIDPIDVRVARVGLPLALVDLEGQRLSVASIPITIHTDGEEEQIRIDVPVDDPWAQDGWAALNVELPEIPGFGIGTTDVSVRLLGDPAMTLADVDITASNGNIVGALTDGGDPRSGTVRLRSYGTQGGSVTLTSDRYGQLTSEVEYSWPITYLLAALLGGVLGGIATAVLGEWNGAVFAKAAISGVVIGLIWSVAYAFGITAIDLAPDMGVSAAAVFTVAALTTMAQLKVTAGRA